MNYRDTLVEALRITPCRGVGVVQGLLYEAALEIAQDRMAGRLPALPASEHRARVEHTSRRLLGKAPEVPLSELRSRCSPQTRYQSLRSQVVSITADVKKSWSNEAQSTYESSDYPTIATREALQNSVDAIRSAIKLGRKRTQWAQKGITIEKAKRVSGEMYRLRKKHLQESQQRAASGDRLLDSSWIPQARQTADTIALDYGRRRLGTGVEDLLNMLLFASDESVQSAEKEAEYIFKRILVGEGAGEFNVDFDEEARTISWTDNGLGMSSRTIREKFLSLGGSTKSGGESGLDLRIRRAVRKDKEGGYIFRLNGLFQMRLPPQTGGDLESDYIFDYHSSGDVGGFGVAKAVILAVSESTRWELRSRDNVVRCDGDMTQIKIEKTSEFLLGTKLTVYDARNTNYDRSALTGDWISLVDRLRQMLSFNEIDGVSLKVNGRKVPYAFRGKRPRILGVTGKFKGKRLEGFWGDSPSPESTGYPFNRSRERLSPQVRESLRELARDLEKAELPTASLEDIIYDPGMEGSRLPKGLESASKLLEDIEISDMLEDLDAITGSYLKARAGVIRDEVPETTPGAAPLKPKKNGPSWAPGLAEVVQGEGTALEAVHVLREELGAIQTSQGDSVSATSVVTSVGQSVLDKIESGAPIDSSDVEDLSAMIVRAEEAASAPGGQGFGGVVRVNSALNAVFKSAELQPEAKKAVKAHRRNPFGSFAGFYIRKSEFKARTGKYDYNRANTFWNNPKRWMPYMIVWDSFLRVIARACRIREGFRPGFVLSNKLEGLYHQLGAGGTRIVYIEPYKLQEVIRGYSKDPMAVAAFLRSVAVHELAHMVERSSHLTDYGAHGDEWATVREEMDSMTASLMPALTMIVRKGLPKFKKWRSPMEIERDKALSRAESWKKKAHEARKSSGRSLKKEFQELKDEFRLREEELNKRNTELLSRISENCNSCLDDLLRALQDEGHLDTIDWLEHQCAR